MANTYIPITSTVLGTNSSSIILSSIPNTYKDLVLKVSARITQADIDGPCNMRFSGDTASNYSVNYILAFTSAGIAGQQSNATSFNIVGGISAANATANTFGNLEIYIPNYANSAYKQIGLNHAPESVTTYASWLYPYFGTTSGYWRNSSAVDSIELFGPTFVAGTSLYLYGIS